TGVVPLPTFPMNVAWPLTRLMLYSPVVPPTFRTAKPEPLVTAALFAVALTPAGMSKPLTLEKSSVAPLRVTVATLVWVPAAGLLWMSRAFWVASRVYRVVTLLLLNWLLV